MLQCICTGKLKSILVSMVILLTFFNPMLIASATGSESISIGSATVNPGDTVVLPITIADVTNVTGVDVTIVYDANIVIIQNVVANSSVSGSSVSPNIENDVGKTTIAYTNTDYVTATSAVTIIDITFEVVGSSGSSTLELQEIEFGDALFNVYTPGTINNGEIAIAGSNVAPVADNQSVTTLEDTSVDITLSATDVDGDSLTYTIVSEPAYGTVTLSGTINIATYTPDANYNGTDSFTFKANDGTVDSNTATVSLTVSADNDAPVADNQSVTTLEDTSIDITLSATDVDGDSLTYTIVSEPAYGTVTLSGTINIATYTPDANYNGADSFTFKANDGIVDSNTATVSLTVSEDNDAPVADSNGPYMGTEGSEIAFDGSASSDLDGTIESYNWDFGDENSGTGVTPTHVYGQDGIYTVTLTVTDNGGATDSDSTTVVVGNIAPTVTIHSPSDITNNSTPLLNATFDQIATSTWYVIDGAAGTGGSNTDNLTVTLPQLVDGQHTVKVYANNSDGNVGSETQNFLVDTIAPAIMIDQVTSLTNDSSQTITGTFDESGSGINSITVNGVAATISGVNYSATIGLTEETNSVSVIAVDNAGNSGSNSTTIVLDTIAPVITIDQVTSLTNVSSQTITGTFDESSSGIDLITVNGVAATISDTVYSAIINLTEGTNPVDVIAVDNAGNSGSNSTIIVLDTIAPTASITAPVNSTIKYFENIIKGNVSDEHFDYAELKVSSGSDVSTYNLTITDNSFAQRVEFTPDQNNTLELLAFDTAGNFNTDTVTVFVHNNTMQVDYNVSANASISIDAMNETDTMIEFHSNVTESNVTFTVTAITDPALVNSLNNSSSMFGEVAMGKIVEINVTPLDATNESQVKYVRIELYYTINDLDLDGDGTVEPGELDEDNLFIYWYNESDESGNWTKLLMDDPDWVLDNGQVKISDDNPVGHVWVEVEHLSMFGLAALLEPELSDGGNGNGNGDDSGSSGSSGGGSGSSGEAYHNIAVKEVIRKYITVDTTNTYQFEKDANAIGFVTFDAKTNAGYIAATVEVLKETSALVSTGPSGKVYQNMNIWIGKAGYATKNNIANPVIGFKVAKSWITENDLDESTIKLNRYSSDAWNQLPTTKTDEDDSYIYFSSETPGFSPFAITGDERSSTVVADTDGSLLSPPSSTADDDMDEPVGEVASVPHDEAKSSNGLILIIGLIGTCVLGVGMYLRKDDDWKVDK